MGFTVLVQVALLVNFSELVGNLETQVVGVSGFLYLCRTELLVAFDSPVRVDLVLDLQVCTVVLSNAGRSLKAG